MRNDAPSANVVAFHLGVSTDGEGDQTKEAGERCAESGTFPTRFDSDGQVVSMNFPSAERGAKSAPERDS